MGFFDKLKMGSGEKSAKKEAASHEKPAEESKKKKIIKSKPEKVKIKPETGKQKDAPEENEVSAQRKQEEPAEGELAIDVYETDSHFVIQSTIAGIKTEDLDITIENDIVTIRGSREKQISEETKKYYYQECYWGAFARQVILPEEVDGSKAEASMKDGVLTLKIPKIVKIQKHKVAIKQAG